MFTESAFDSNAEIMAKRIGNSIGTAIGAIAMSYPLQALAVWAFWNWLAWNILNAPQINYWIALAAVVAISWFIGLFRKK